MSTEAIINELASIRATAEVLAERATRLESLLIGKASVSTPAASQQFQKKLASVLAGRQKRLAKK